MTITQDASAPLFVVVGSTGVQGGSVIRALKASPQAYRVRAITRDTSKPAATELASLGCELVSADIGSPGGANRAFQGADLGFAMTIPDFSDGVPSRDKEFADGKAQVDAAKAAGVKTLVWAGLSNMSELSGGKNKVDHFDVKAEVTSYARSISDDTFKVIDVQPGAYLSNYLTSLTPKKQDDGSFTLALPYDPDTKLPIIDSVADYGSYVVAAVEKGGIETVLTAREYITPVEMAEEFSKASGKQVNFQRLPDDQLLSILINVQGEKYAKNAVATIRAFREVGYYGGEDLDASNSILPTPARTFGEMLAAHKEDVARLFA